ncbi:hypothetical protein Ait01nite_036010 [Actinoplanes italicus]|uniref:Uncharacterized protein n=1 Tax=Actinoplanes italicus TaxID=113567 RepID=A0A2T0K8M1_9ACTN|nr:hypothetical protein [Actinoplanes italicus]PRX19429.1 hypothetical protein CLV67_110181 [Actinoplanes italicus]GIE30556.1 hypothetical protein Ait01nite_036010 [Actinoplanes italicus]
MDGGDMYFEWSDTDGDGIIDSQLVDADGDGQTDLQITDANLDGTADKLLMDHTGDGIADLLSERDAFGIEHVTVDADGDTLADAEFTDGPFPADPPPAEEALFVVDDAPPVFDTAAPTVAPVPAGLTGDTAALVGSINSQMADAGLIYDSAMNPGSVSGTDVNAAMERADNAARNAQSLAGYTYEDQVSNEIYKHDLEQQYLETAHTEATDAWIESENAISRADQAVWDSEQERS